MKKSDKKYQNDPVFPYRGIKVYIPAREEMDYFKEFVDYCAYYGYNRIAIEVGGAMEFKKHPEINEGWVSYCRRFSEYQGQSLDIQNSPKWARNSIHCENGGGSFLLQEEMRALVDYCKMRGMEVIPEMPSLSHCDYLLVNHPELRERKEDDLPDTYCPSNPASYQLLFELLDEVIEVFRPECVHIGHDEYFSVGLCEKCRGKDAGELFAEDVKKIYGYLKEKGISTALWGDKLLNAIGRRGQTWGGSRRVITNMRTGEFLEEVPATYHAIDLIPNDILIYHWYWGLNKTWENEFLKRGFPTVMGNFDGLCMAEWKRRSQNGYLGISVSNWSNLNRDHLQRNAVLFNIAYSAYMIYDREFDETCFEKNALRVAHDIYQYQKSSMKNSIEVVHRTSLYKKHEPFVDGFSIDKEDDYLGKYCILFESGRQMEFPLYYNLNIGTSKAGFSIEQADDTENMVYDAQVFESTYTCDLVKVEEEIFYRTAIEIPLGETVKKVTLIQDSKYGRTVEWIETLL